jgi:hypothetical protein
MTLVSLGLRSCRDLADGSFPRWSHPASSPQRPRCSRRRSPKRPFSGSSPAARLQRPGACSSRPSRHAAGARSFSFPGRSWRGSRWAEPPRPGSCSASPWLPPGFRPPRSDRSPPRSPGFFPQSPSRIPISNPRPFSWRRPGSTRSSTPLASRRSRCRSSADRGSRARSVGGERIHCRPVQRFRSSVSVRSPGSGSG